MKVDEVKEKLKKGEKVQFVDVRSEEEVAAWPALLPGIVNIPLGPELEQAASQLANGTEVITVCTKGVRCQRAAEALKAKGVKADYLEGGLDAWENSD